jgi:guanylate cyclase, other
LELKIFRYLNESRQIQWVGGEMPRAEPPCGFHGEKCEYPLDWRVTAPLGAIAALVVVAAVFLFR